MAAAKKNKKKRSPKAPSRRRAGKAPARGKATKQSARKSAGKPAKRPARKPSSKPAVKQAAARADLSLTRERARLERNKQLVLAFYAKMIGEKDPDAARPFMGDPYVQHSPYAQDGFEGVASFARQFKRDFPNHTYDVKRVLAEGDFVMLHLHGKQGLSPHGEAVVDLFRVRNGKVVEHWDVIQSLPEKSENPNGPF